MKRLPIWVLILFLACARGVAAEATETRLSFGNFGTVTLYSNRPQPANVVLFVSGDGGWNLGVVAMARELAQMDSLVVGIDIRTYLKNLDHAQGACSYPASDFEALSQAIQKKLSYPRYVTPVLVGYSSGATLVYAILAQAPPTTFAGGVSLGFCPDLLVQKPFCRGTGLEARTRSKARGFVFLPAGHLEVPWVALQGKIDQVCDPPATQKFVDQVKNGQVFMLDKVGHGYAVPRNWMPQFKSAFQIVLARKTPEPTPVRAEDLRSLPLIELEPERAGDTLAVWITGDGGWGVTDRGVAQKLSENGVPVVALNSLHYFWNRRTPEQAAADFEKILRHYLEAWQRNRIIVAGYSFGADALPFLLNGLSPDLRARISVVALLGLSHSADFEIHVADWFTSTQRETSQPTIPQVEKLRGKQILCFYGAEDHDNACSSLPAGLAQTISHPGGHRFGRDFEWIADEILKAEKESAVHSPKPAELP